MVSWTSLKPSLDQMGHGASQRYYNITYNMISYRNINTICKLNCQSLWQYGMVQGKVCKEMQFHMKQVCVFSIYT